MREFFRFRTWAGPVTIGSFVVMGISGILLFFHVNIGLMKLAHEWLGWVFVVGAVAHLAVNWRPFVAYFRKPAGLAIMAVLLLAGVLSLLPAGGGGPSPRQSFMAMSRALEQAPLSAVAQVAKRSPQSVQEDLESKGIQVRHGEQTISEIASDNEKHSMEILTHVFGGTTEPDRGPRGPGPGAH
jgi:hypothetical protein